MMTLGKNIQALRKENQMTQSELAEKLLVSRQAVSKWESDFNEPDIKTLIALSDIFHVTIDELVKGTHIQEELESHVIDDIDIDEEQMTSEILKTNKKNHKLLVFITGFIVCLLVVFVICLCMSSSSEPTYVNDEEDIAIHDNIAKQVNLDHELVQAVSFDIKLIDYQNQKMKFQGELSTYLPMKEGTLTVVYTDQDEEKLEIYPSFQSETSYAFQKEMPAKNIDKIIIEIDGKTKEYSNVVCPIENYMYEIDFQAALESQSQNSFHVNLSATSQQDTSSISFENVISVENYDDENTSYIELAVPLKVVIKKNDQVIQEKTIETKEQLNEPILIKEQYNSKAKYTIKITYQTPLKQKMEWNYIISENDFLHE